MIDLQLRAATLPQSGVVLSKTLAESLQLKVGDPVTVETMEGERRVVDVPIADLLDDFGGTSVYMDLDALNRLLREGAHHLRRVYQLPIRPARASYMPR